MGEHQRTVRLEDMATTSTAVATVSPPVQEEVERVAVITLRPTATKKEERKKVVWTEDTVDNEHMNKKKSKCCCIYEKPRRFDESDSEDSGDECERCYGHVEKRHHHHHQRPQEATVTINEAEEIMSQEPTATLPLQPPQPTPAPPDKALPTS